jgi:hypothetical protein
MRFTSLSFASHSVCSGEAARWRPAVLATGLLLILGLLLTAGPLHAQDPPGATSVFEHLDRTAPTAPGGVRAKAGVSDLAIKDPIQQLGGTRFPDPTLNVRPDGDAVPAGDVDGDGVNDWLYRYTTADDRSTDPSATTPKTFLRYGGGDFSARYFDELYYRELVPVGNFVGGNAADAVALLDGGRGGFEVFEGGSGGYQQVDTRTQTSISGQKVAPTDLSGDGYDDLLYVRSNTPAVQVVFGAQSPAGIADTSYSPSFGREAFFAYTAGDLDGDGTGELVRVTGNNDSGTDDSLGVDIFTVGTGGALATEQSLAVAGNLSASAANLSVSLANIDGTGLKEIILQTDGDATFVLTSSQGAYENTPIEYYPGLRLAGDLNGDGRADFAITDTSSGDAAVAFGPSTVSNGLTPDLGVSGPDETVDLPRTALDGQPTFGDLDGDGRDEVVVQTQGTSRFGPRLVGVSSEGSSLQTADVRFDNGPYRTSRLVHGVNLGDWGGDSTDDFALLRQATDFGANGGAGRDVGRVEIYFGDPTASAQPDLTLTHPDGAAPGMAVAGDFTGNGTPNLAVSWQDSLQNIEVYEAGQGTTPIHTIDFPDLAPGISDDLFPFATSIGNVGDVNKDGADDLLVGAPETNRADSSFLFLGGPSLSTQPDEVVNLGSGTDGVSIQGLGDINGDQVDDFAVGAGPISGGGALRVFFGSNGTVDFGQPDVSITLQPESGELLGGVGTGLAVGDFNADDTTDLATYSLTHSSNFDVSTANGIEAIRIHHGGAAFDSTAERKLFVPGPPLGLRRQYKSISTGELTPLPDLNGDGSDELLYGTVSLLASGATNALVYDGNGPSAPQPTTVLRAPDPGRGLGADNNNTLNANLGSAIGDFNGDGTTEALVPQEDARGFRATPIYIYQPGTGDTAPQDTPVASDTSTIDSTDIGTKQTFGDTGASITFSDSTEGSGDVVVEEFDGPPVGGGTIPARNVSAYRVEISVSGGLTVGDSTELRFDVGKISGVGDPSQVSVFTREVSGLGGFTRLETSYDAQENELVALVSGFSEFAFGSDTEPLPVELTAFDGTSTDDGVRLTWRTASEQNNAGFRIERRLSAGERGGVGAWTRVGFVDGVGTTSEAQSYRFTDADLPYEAGEVTYRLTQVDTDGATHISESVTVERGVTEVQLLGTFPNPARQQATIRYALPEQQAPESSSGQRVTLRLYDVLGRQVRTVVSSEKEGRHVQRIDVGGLSSGIYFLRLQAGGETRTQKVTVVR